MHLNFFVVTYEFIFCPFSGNGILAQSLVNSLIELGHFVSVWCTKPNIRCDDEEVIEEVFPRHDGRLQILTTTVDNLQWKCLDENSAWETFAYSGSDEATQAGLKALCENTSGTSPIPIVIDWHGSHAYRSLSFGNLLSPPIYMNFRVYAAGIQDEKRHSWLNQMERQALQAADKVIALSQHDKELLVELSDQDESCQNFEVFYPPLRKDIQKLGTMSSFSPPLPLPEALPPGKQFVTCVVRLSPEKETLRFIPFLESIRGLMDSKQWIPLLAGSPSDKAYAQIVRDKLKDKFPSAIDLVGTFLNPKELCGIFQNTVINFHPSSYDAYGMTIVEAAAMGVPSVIANNGQVGSSHLIQDACVLMEMPALGEDASLVDKTLLPDASNQHLMTLLQDEITLQKLGEDAKERALAWSELAYGKRLVKLASSIDHSLDNNEAVAKI